MINELKDKAIVLNSTDYKENDKLVTLFTLEHGKIKARMRGVKKRGAKLAYASQLFCFADYILSKNGDYYTVINASQIDSFYDISNDLNDYYGASVILEVADTIIRQEEPNPEMFVNVLSALKTLEYYDKNVMLVISKFLILSMKASGYEINTDNCTECGKKIDTNIFSFDHGGFVCNLHKGTNSTILSDAGVRLLKYLEKNSFEDLPDDAVGSKNVMKLLAYYFEEKTETKLNSLKIFLQ